MNKPTATSSGLFIVYLFASLTLPLWNQFLFIFPRRRRRGKHDCGIFFELQINNALVVVGTVGRLHNALHLHRISLRVLAENAAARRSYEKAGFVQEGVFRDMELLDGAYRDVVFMAKLAEN